MRRLRHEVHFPKGAKSMEDVTPNYWAATTSRNRPPSEGALNNIYFHAPSNRP